MRSDPEANQPYDADMHNDMGSEKYWSVGMANSPIP
jgi:hypothetical protein